MTSQRFLYDLARTLFLGAALAACNGSPGAVTEPVVPDTQPDVRPQDPGLSYDPGCLAELPVDNRIIGGGAPPDGIPAIVNAAFLPAGDVDYLANSDRVLGAELHGRFFAFPVKIMNFHEIVNFSVEGDRYAATWCPLAHAYVLFRNPDWKDTQTPRSAAFRASGLLMDDNLVMYDQKTNSRWPQLLGMAISGPLAGSCLVVERNTAATSWKIWRELHPETLVLSNRNEATGVPSSEYDHDPYEAYHRSPDTVHQPTYPDDRRAAKSLVLGVHAEGVSAAVVLTRPVSQAKIGSTPAVFFRDAASGTAYGFQSVLDGTARLFADNGPGASGLPTFMDLETRSVWTLDGIAVSGPLAGRRLPQLPGAEVYWFVWSSLFPGTPIVAP